MYILSINISHHASSCLLEDGEVIYYIEEERLSKIKNHEYDSCNDNGVDLNSKYYGMEYLKDHTNYVDYVIFSSFGRFDGEDDIIISNFKTQFKREKINVKEWLFFPQNHHIYHAVSGFYQSQFDNAVCLVLDGGGSAVGEVIESKIPIREVESIYYIEYPDIVTTLFKNFSSSSGYQRLFKKDIVSTNNTFAEICYTDSLSCGKLFSSISIALGFKNGLEAGKVMGLSSYGKKRSPEFDNWFCKFDNVWITNNSIIMPYYENKIDIKTEFQKAADIAAKVQEETLDHTLRLIDKALTKSNSKNIILSGGYALNCVNNYEYLKYLPKDVNLYIDPISHDGGTSYGAAKFLWYYLTKDLEKKPFNSLYLGKKYI
jgi:carbamoyltransferase